MRPAVLLLVGIVARAVADDDMVNPYLKYADETFEEGEIRKAKERAIMEMENNEMHEWRVAPRGGVRRRRKRHAGAPQVLRPERQRQALPLRGLPRLPRGHVARGHGQEAPQPQPRGRADGLDARARAAPPFF